MAEQYANLEEFFETQDEEVVEDATQEDEAGEATGEGEEVQGEGAVEEGQEQDGEGAASEAEAGESDQPQPDNEGDTGDGATAEAGDTKPDTGIDIETDDIATLRQMLREQAQEIQTLKSQSQGLNKTLVDQGTIDESDLDPGEQESGGIDDNRIQSLSLLAETMKMNPNYSDFEDVCSQSNFDMTVDALAKLAVQEEGGTLTEQVQNVTNYIWNLPNPYKFVYDLVKENHPKYQQSTDEQREPSESTARRETPKAPGSVATVAGGSSSKNEGWTAAKIEALDELELDKVPAAVYTKYMQGDLK